MRLTLFFAPLVLGLAACAAVQLTPAAEQVQVVPAVPHADCQALGTVVGAGSRFDPAGAWNEALIDARNQVAALGATHLVAGETKILRPPQGDQPPQPQQAATLAYAYRCR